MKTTKLSVNRARVGCRDVRSWPCLVTPSPRETVTLGSWHIPPARRFLCHPQPEGGIERNRTIDDRNHHVWRVLGSGLSFHMEQRAMSSSRFFYSPLMSRFLQCLIFMVRFKVCEDKNEFQRLAAWGGSCHRCGAGDGLQALSETSWARRLKHKAELSCVLN